MTARQHLRATLCLAGIALQLTFWALLLLLLLPAKATSRTRPWFRRTAARIYRAAVRVDNMLLRRISRASWTGRELRLDPTRPHIVLSNHRAWTDIFLVQSLIATKGPIVTFLCKRELLYLPVVGLIILAFDFPVLRRRARRGASAASRRSDDRRRVREAAAALLEFPTAILSFAEGTRFTIAKRDAYGRGAADRQGPNCRGPDKQDAAHHRRDAADRQGLNSRGPEGHGAADRHGPNGQGADKQGANGQAQSHGRYEHLLPPRVGGFAAMIEALAPGGGSIVDLTLAYPRPSTFWEFLGGAAGSAKVHWETMPIAAVQPDEAATWLNERWQRKEELLERFLCEAAKICAT